MTTNTAFHLLQAQHLHQLLVSNTHTSAGPDWAWNYGLKDGSASFCAWNLHSLSISQNSFFFSFLNTFEFYCCSSTVFCLFPPPLPPPPALPTSLPFPPRPCFCPCALYTCSCKPFTLCPPPITPSFLPFSLWQLLICLWISNWGWVLIWSYQ